MEVTSLWNIYNKYEKDSRKLSVDVVKKLVEYYNSSVGDRVD